MQERKTQHEKDARRRLRSVTPANCGKVVARSCYWTVDFLHLYLDACDAHAFDVPDDGYTMAVQAPELARRIPVGSEAGDYGSEAEKISSRVLAYAVFGSCCRAASRLSEAESAFRLAFDLSEGDKVDPIAVAELTRRFAVLLFQQNQAAAAMGQAQRALELCRQASFAPGLADALLLRALIRTDASKAGATDYVEAMCFADLRTPRGRRTFGGALQNLALAATTQAVTLQEQEQACKLLQTVKEMLARQPKSVRKMKVYWTEGLMLQNLGVSRHAARRLLKARRGFLELQELVDFVLVSLDLAALYRDEGDHGSLETLAEETCQVVSEQAEDPRLLEALQPWRRSPGKVTEIYDQLRGREWSPAQQSV